jgi:hypothetical protein
VSLKKGGEDVPAGTPLEPGVEYAARVKDADGAEYDAVLGYEVTRPASPDGKFPAIMQPVAHTDKSPPNTEKLNIVIGKIDPKDEKAAWLEPAALEEKLGSLDGYEGVYSVFTIFPGTYSPAANEPISSQVDTVMGITGNEFWRSHALLKK